MPLVFIPDSTFTSHPHQHHPYHRQLPPQAYQLSPFASLDESRLHYPFSSPRNTETSEALYPVSQSYSQSVEARKRQLLAEFAAQLNEAYPSTSRVDPRAAAAERERIRYLEAKQMEQEQLRLRISQRQRERKLLRLEAEREEIRQMERARLIAARQVQLQQYYEQQQQLRARELRAQQAARQLFAFGPYPMKRQALPAPAHRCGSPHERPCLTLPSRNNSPEPEAQDETSAVDQFGAFMNGLLSSVDLGQRKATPPPPSPGARIPESRPSNPSSKLNKDRPISALSNLRLLQARASTLLSPINVLPPIELQHHLTNILLAADGIESDGDEVIRKERKALVVRVEAELEKLDEVLPPPAKDISSTVDSPASMQVDAAPSGTEEVESSPAAPESEAVVIPINSPSLDAASLPAYPSAIEVSSSLLPPTIEARSSSPVLPFSEPTSSPSPAPAVGEDHVLSDRVSVVSDDETMSVGSGSSHRSHKVTVEDWTEAMDAEYEIVDEVLL